MESFATNKRLYRLSLRRKAKDENIYTLDRLKIGGMLPRDQSQNYQGEKHSSVKPVYTVLMLLEPSPQLLAWLRMHRRRFPFVE